MQEETISLTRQGLYEQVWSEPIAHLSKLYNLSEAGLSRICNKMDVPLPSDRYWEEKHGGRDPERVALPPFKGPRNGKIRITIRAQTDTDDEFEERVVFEGFPEDHDARVKSSLEDPHRLVELTETCLRKTKPDYKGLLYVYDKGCLDLTVSPKNLDRALRIFDATIKTCEKKGYEVSVSNSMREHKTIVKVLGEHLEIVLRETYFEKTNSVNQNKSSVYNRREYAPSGYLSLTIRNERHTRHKSWNDGKRRLIEDCLDDFLEGLLYMAEQEEEEREKRKKEEEERRERTRQYQEAAKARQEEEARVTALRSEAANWHESQQIRAYVSAVREKTLQNEGEIDPDSDLARWLLWANEQADRIDPLADNPRSVLDIEIEPPFRWH